MAIAAPAPPLWQTMASGERSVITLAVMLATLMQMLDTTIANVALPHMQSSLGANSETVNWVLTSYIVALAVAIPVTGWLADRVGRKRLMVWTVIIFTFASLLCGLAQNLSQMVAFRIIQGVAGAFIVPLAQAVMLDINPPERHARAMAMFGGGIMIAPILGPVLGGWLTESFNWRWVFIVNLPVGVLATVMLLRFLPFTPPDKRRFDLFGFALLALAIGSMQMMLDRGGQLDWFQSWEVWIEGGLAIGAAWMFCVHLLSARNPIFDPKMFADGNFAMGMLFMSVTGLLLLGGLALLPPLLQRLMGYSVFDAGLLTAPRGISTFMSMMVVGRLMEKVDPRILIFTGFALMALSLWQMSGFALAMDSRPVIWTGLLQGFGIGLIFVPLNTLAFGTLAPRFRTTAASLLNLSRSIGGSVGISMVTTLLARNLQTSHADIASQLTAARMPVADPALAQPLGPYGEGAMALLDLEVNRQAMMIAFIDDFHLMMLITLCTLPLVLLLKKAKKPESAPIMLD